MGQLPTKHNESYEVIITTWRAKYYYIDVSPTRKLVVTLRRFKTAPAKRSHAYKQIVLPFYWNNAKEIAIRQQVRGRSARRRANISGFWQLRASVSLVLIAVGLIGAGVFGLQIYKGQALRPVKTYASIAPVVISANQSMPRSEPTHISVPSVGIDTKIVSVGLDSNGSIELPPLFDWSAGWYKYSPTPGQLGPSIIVGHVDTYEGVSVFWRLRDIKEGDLVYVSRADGKTAKFKVQALKVFDQQDFPTQEVYGNLDYSGLRLITCGGAFDKQGESYTQNTVVYASLEI